MNTKKIIGFAFILLAIGIVIFSLVIKKQTNDKFINAKNAEDYEFEFNYLSSNGTEYPILHVIGMSKYYIKLGKKLEELRLNHKIINIKSHYTLLKFYSNCSLKAENSSFISNSSFFKFSTSSSSFSILLFSACTSSIAGSGGKVISSSFSSISPPNK